MLNPQLLTDLKVEVAKQNLQLEVTHIECMDLSQFNLITASGRTLGSAQVTHAQQIFSARNKNYHNDLVDTVLRKLIEY